jgi:hypothetical protein
MKLTTPPTPSSLHHTYYTFLPPVTLSLAIGSPLSELETLKQKITAINAKHGPFDAVVLVGDVFAPGSDGSELDGLSCECGHGPCKP